MRVPVTQIGPLTNTLTPLAIKRLQSYFLGPIGVGGSDEMVQLVLSVPPFSAACCQSDSIKVGKGTWGTGADLDKETYIEFGIEDVTGA